MSLADWLLKERTPKDLAKELAAKAHENAALRNQVHALEYELFWKTEAITMTKHTAAQPLDLEALEETLNDAARWSGGQTCRRKIESALAMIAKARAAQPESAALSVASVIASIDRGEDDDGQETPEIWTREEVLDMLKYEIVTDSGARTLLNGDGMEFTLEELALLANRAAELTRQAVQPERATGTTGAIQSIDTPDFRDLLHEVQALFIGDDRRAKAALIAHIDAIIADLRAQLAAKGQGNAVAVWKWTPAGHRDEPEWRLETLVRVPESDTPVYLYLGTPASAQLADVCAEMRALCPNCGGTGEAHRADGEYMGACDCPASAQPDRGAAQDETEGQ